MKTLNNQQMENINGGGWLAWASCGLSSVGLVATLIGATAIPTGGLSVAFGLTLGLGITTEVLSTGISCGVAAAGK